MVSNNEQSIANQFVWVLHNKKGNLIEAFELAGVDVDENATPLQLKKIVEKAVESYTTTQNEKARNLIFNISKLIASNEGMYATFWGDDEDDEEEDEELEELPFDTSKYGEKKPKWYESFKLDDILKVGNLLIGAFKKGRVSDDDATTPPPSDTEVSPSGVSVGRIVGISVGVLALVGIGVLIYKISTK